MSSIISQYALHVYKLQHLFGQHIRLQLIYICRNSQLTKSTLIPQSHRIIRSAASATRRTAPTLVVENPTVIAFCQMFFICSCIIMSYLVSCLVSVESITDRDHPTQVCCLQKIVHLFNFKF